MSDAIHNQIAALKKQGEALIAAISPPEEVRVSFCSCGEQWIEPSDDGNQHVSHTYVTKRYVVAPWIAGRDGGSQ